MDATDLAELIDAHRRFPAALQAVVDGLPDELWRARPAADKWSALEVIVHLRDEEVEDFRPRARHAADGTPITAGIDPQGWVLARRYNDQDPAQVLADLGRERAASCAWLATVQPAQLEIAVTVRRGQELRCGDFIAAWRMHDLLHLRQLLTTLIWLEADRRAGWRFGYAGEIPALS